MFDQYKANRSAPPDDLIPQFDLIQKLVEKMGLPSFQLPRYEADDIIGSAAVQWKKDFDEILKSLRLTDLIDLIRSD